jgi:hypothetical protein
MSDASSKM